MRKRQETKAYGEVKGVNGEFQNFAHRSLQAALEKARRRLLTIGWSSYANRLKEAEHFGYLRYYTDSVYRITGDRK